MQLLLRLRDGSMPAVQYEKRKGKRREYQNYLVQPHFFWVTAGQSGRKIKGGTMKRFNLMLILLLLPFLTSACRGLFSREQPDHLPVLEPGSEIDNMVITTGVEDAVPLWAYCHCTSESDKQITVACPELSYPKLAIGTVFNLRDLIPASIDMPSLTWEIYLDEQPVNLNAFDIHDIVTPDLLPSPSPVREGFMIITVWDIVLENPTPGSHTLQGMARSEDETYSWAVDFTVGKRP